jgi:hypothetical protein
VLGALSIACVLAASARADPEVSLETATQALFPDGAPASCHDIDNTALPSGSADGRGQAPTVECLIAARYAHDDKAAHLALALYRDTGSIAGLGADEQMDGGYRGQIHLVPQLPVAGYRQHLAWVAAALDQIGRFYSAQLADVATPAYRWRALRLAFVRSVDKHTPSAYATSWSITYNVEGSLLTSADGVRETLVHELFHLNDEQHHDWSGKTLAKDYQAILDKCGAHPTLRCLAPYAPNSTVVRGGTYYAFQQNNGDAVHEYAAELAVRYFDEQSEMRRRGRLARRAFKCGPAENARSWQAFVDEFFAGRDLVPSC